MLTKDEILSRIAKEDIKRFGVKSLELFGSYAYDAQAENSDIDFLVEFHEGRGRFDDYLKSTFANGVFNWGLIPLPLGCAFQVQNSHHH